MHWSYSSPEGGNWFKNLRDCSVVAVAVANVVADADVSNVAEIVVFVFVSPMAGICWGFRFFV